MQYVWCDTVGDDKDYLEPGLERMSRYSEVSMIKQKKVPAA